MLEDLSISMVKRAVFRRIWMILAIAIVGTTGAMVWAYSLPPSYVAHARVLIESQQIPERLASTTVMASANERLQVIEQRLMTRDNLLSLNERLGLYPNMNPSAVVGIMRGSTKFRRMRLGSRRGANVSAFQISYRDSNPGRAARITNEFVTLVLEQNLRVRSERASETLQFFETEVSRLEQALTKAESDRAQFTIDNRDALPGSLNYRRETLSRLETQRIELQRQVNELEERDRLLTRRLERGQYGPNSGNGAIQQELASLRQELIKTRAIYQPGHPKVRRLETLIAELSSVDRTQLLPDEVVEQRDYATQDAREELERKITVTREDLRLVRKQLDTIDTRSVALEKSIDRTPEVTLQLNALNRRASDLLTQYEQALRKKADAETGEKLEVNRQAERFEVIEQARVPESPSSPDRPKIATAGAALSIGLGLGLALLLELLHRAIWTPAELERRLEMRPLITVPYIETSGERSRRKRKFVFRAMLLILAVPATIWAAHTFYMPLDLLAERVVERSGVEGILNKIAQRIGL